MGESKDQSFEENLAQLEGDGFLLIKTPSIWKLFRNGGTVCMDVTTGENMIAETVSVMCHITSCWRRNRR